MKNTFLLNTFLYFGLFLLIFSCKPENEEEPIPPNIILVMTDDQGYGDISAHGSPDVSTPNMDKLKTQSISLEDFQVSPTCAPTRSALMSGRHPFKNGITHTILERERMALGLTTLPQVLKRGGYTSGIFGKWHLGDEQEYQPDSRGFDEVFIHGAGGIGQAYAGSCADVPDNGYFDPVVKHNGTFVKTAGFCTDVFFTQALSWIQQKSSAKEPFFAYITTNAPHGPFIAPEKYKKKFIDQGYPEDAQGFYGMIENVDDNLGVLMDKLDAWGIAENTILIFMTDNGKTYGGYNTVHGETYNAGMRGFKGSVYEGGTRVPFFIRWPNVFRQGNEVDVMLNHYDLLPTFAEIANIDISDIPDLDGKSFYSNLINDSIPSEDRFRFFHGGRWPLNPNNISGQDGTDRWVGTEETSNPDNSKYKKFAVRNKRYRFVNNNELYDLSQDPGEKNNIAEEQPELIAEMRAAYEAWWSDVRPLMVNENAPLAKEKPFWVEYQKQVETTGIKDWVKPDME
ncbi:arylsulfatase [Cyclobacterium sp. 1_MG-2023]|uniref:arylsulfatase n=1 Tax=Cyclobacterium sp. 1_MG-2023 TaxID=3062681 RepID=UPI0026E1DD36|nr:arylsulfatase [Cyclobacterium sp. 1_MG-2023]MDO6436193.1 arylsulfatase [Cyclobacterium sp. 1_MG-2023]